MKNSILNAGVASLFVILFQVTLSAQVNTVTGEDAKAAEQKMTKERAKGIPVPEDYFFEQHGFDYVLSQDGSRMAYLDYVNANAQLFVKKVGEKTGKQITNEKNYSVKSFTWISSDGILVEMVEGGSNLGIYRIIYLDSVGGDILLSKQGYQISIVTTCGFIPGKFYFSKSKLNNQKGENDALFEFDLMTKKTKLIHEYPGHVDNWLINRNGELMGMVICAGEEREVLKLSKESKYPKVLSLPNYVYFEPILFSADGKSLLCLSNHLSNFKEVVSIKFDIYASPEVIFSVPETDVESVILDHSRNLPVGAVYGKLKAQVEIWDADYKSIYSQMEMKKPKGTTIVPLNSDLKSENFILKTLNFKSRSEYFIFSKKNNTIEILTTSATNNLIPSIGEVQTFQFESDLKISLNGYLIKPAKATSTNAAILMFHENPWSSISNEFDSEVSYLTALGYQVLMIDHVGSAGYGKKSIISSSGQMDDQMITDVLNGFEHARKNNILAAREVVLYGKGEGAHMALVTFMKRPDLFKGLVAIRGFSSVDSHISRLSENISVCSKSLTQRYINPNGYFDLYNNLSREEQKKEGDVHVFLASGKLDPYYEESVSIEEMLKNNGFAVSTYYPESLAGPFDRKADMSALSRDIKRYLDAVCKTGKVE